MTMKWHIGQQTTVTGPQSCGRFSSSAPRRPPSASKPIPFPRCLLRPISCRFPTAESSPEIGRGSELGLGFSPAVPCKEPMLGCGAAMLRLGNLGLGLSAGRSLLGTPSGSFAHSAKGGCKSLLSGLGISGGLKIHTSQLSNKSISISANSSSVSSRLLIDQGEEVELLTAVNDNHGGVKVEIKAPVGTADFISSLRASISNWRQQGKRGVWLKLPIEHANLVQPAVKEGFWYHHAEPSYLMLVYWIPATKNTLPVNATHRVGVGAFVMNDKREVLAVQERSGKFQGSGVWKFPTGVVDQGEDIFAGAIREVKEETGIDTEFVEVLAFRQSHMSFFEKSDLFFICMLRPLSFVIQKQEREIEAAQWMRIDEFAAQPFAQKHELLKYIIDVGLAKVDRGYSGFSPATIKSAFTDRQSSFYLNSRDLKQPPVSGDASDNI